MAQTIQFNTQLSFGVAGCPFKSERAVQLALNGTYIVSQTANAAGLPGWFMVLTSVNDVLQYSPDGGVTWRTVVPASSFGVFYSDGQNWRLLNSGAADVGGVNTRLTPIDII